MPSPAQEQSPKLLTRYTYVNGPIYYIGQRIVRQMQLAGWPSKISECYRSPERQDKLRRDGFSKAAAWASAHQYWLAVDIIHATRGWDVPEDYWTDLAASVAIVSEEMGIALEHGHTWKFRDSAHIELADFRRWRSAFHGKGLNEFARDLAFQVLLPKVWNQHTKSATYRPRA